MRLLRILALFTLLAAGCGAVHDALAALFAPDPAATVDGCPPGPGPRRPDPRA
jgi:hypothetical protein